MGPQLSYITSFFDAAGQKIWSRQDLADILSYMHESWNLTSDYGVGTFIEMLLANSKMTRHALSFNFMPAVHYSWGEPRLFELLQAAYPTGYFSHASAMVLHSMLERSDSVVYINVEQPDKNAPTTTLEQSRIDAAFRRPPRTSNNRIEHMGTLVTLLSGKSTGNLGVEPTQHPTYGDVRATSLNRTLIDIVVRPSYSGGPKALDEAYHRVASAVEVGELVQTLTQIKHGYPYHQSVGFLLERSGVSPAQLQPLRDLGINHKFYLDYEMAETAYSADWQLYYPRELDQ